MATRTTTSKTLPPTALYAAGFLAGALIVAPTAFAQSGDAAAGKKAAEFVCRNCHDVSGNEKSRNPPGGAPSFFDVAQKSDTTEKALHKFLTLPHGRMINVLLSGKEVDHVTAYIMSLRRK